MILKALVQNKDKISKAAEALGISRPTLYELMEKLGVGRKKRTGGRVLRVGKNKC